MAAINEALRVSPQSAHSHGVKGLIFQETGEKTKEVFDESETAIALESRNPEHYLLHARFLKGFGKSAEAEEFLKKAQQLKEQNQQ